MARVDTALLILQATDIAGRANSVRQDPAVAKAAKEARADILRAGHSTRVLLRETRAAWLRSTTGAVGGPKDHRDAKLRPHQPASTASERLEEAS